MKKILITQRLEYQGKHKELRNSIDVRLTKFIYSLGFMPILLCNMNPDISHLINDLKPDGIILSGGGDIFDNDKRLILEKKIIELSIKKKIPLVGICRGAQIINKFFNGDQKKIKNHVSRNHVVNFKEKFNKSITTNSYHKYGFDDLLISKDLKILALSKDNIVEFFIHKKYSIYGMMWHPERNKKLKKIDKKIFLKIFSK